ncbi:MAG: hypothetical protein RLZZ630_41 [Bacteroidota bacterium]|jgi:4-hydroxybenzoate polyprenyltransferase
MLSRILPGILGLTASALYFSSTSNQECSLAETAVLSILIGFFTFVIYQLGSRIAIFNRQQKNGKKIESAFLIAPFAIAAIYPFDHPAFLLKSIPQLSVSAILTVAYYRPMNYGLSFINGLREIPMMKNVVLALAWSLATTPFTAERTETLYLLIFRTLFILALSIAIDIRDRQSDSKQNTMTLALMIGSRNCAMASSSILLLAAVLAGTTLSMPDDSWWLPLIIPAHTIITALGVLSLHERSKPITYFWTVDFQLFLHALLFLLIRLTL